MERKDLGQMCCDEWACFADPEVDCSFCQKALCRNHAHVVGEPGSSKVLCGDCLAAAGAVE